MRALYTGTEHCRTVQEWNTLKRGQCVFIQMMTATRSFLATVRSMTLSKRKGKAVKKLEQALKRAEEASHAKSAFWFNMSHDIRTPMNAIIGYTDLLEIYGDDVEKREDYLGKIKSSSEYLLSLLNDVLEMARIESGKYIMDETVTDIREFDRSICDVFENQLEQKGIRSVFL